MPASEQVRQRHLLLMKRSRSPTATDQPLKERGALSATTATTRRRRGGGKLEIEGGGNEEGAEMMLCGDDGELLDGTLFSERQVDKARVSAMSTCYDPSSDSSSCSTPCSERIPAKRISRSITAHPVINMYVYM